MHGDDFPARGGRIGVAVRPAIRGKIVNETETKIRIVEVALLTVEQVAARLSVSVRTVWRMTERGDIPQPMTN